jgi:hypothetical protein
MKFWKKSRSSHSSASSESASSSKEFIEDDGPLSIEELKTLNNELYPFTASSYPSRNSLIPTPNGSFTVESLLQVKTDTAGKRKPKKRIYTPGSNGSTASLFSTASMGKLNKTNGNNSHNFCIESNSGTNINGAYCSTSSGKSNNPSFSNGPADSCKSPANRPKCPPSVSSSAAVILTTATTTPASSTLVPIAGDQRLGQFLNKPNPQNGNPDPPTLSTSSDDPEKHDDEAKGKSSPVMAPPSSTSSPSLPSTLPDPCSASSSLSPFTSSFSNASLLHDHIVAGPRSKKLPSTDVTGSLSTSHATMSNPLTIDTTTPVSSNYHSPQRPEQHRQLSQQKLPRQNSSPKLKHSYQQQLSPQTSHQQNPQLQQFPGREKSLSPMSSMIFERSVQDVHFPVSTSKIPLHHSNDDFIPSVLDASAEILTSPNIDPETVEVLSLRRPSSVRSFSFSDPSHQDSFPRNESIVSTQSFLNNQRFQFLNNDPASTVTSPVPVSPPNPPLVAGSPTSIRSPSNSALSSLTTSPNRNLHRPSFSNMAHGGKKKECCVLSFCSFADLVDCEHAATSPTVTNTTNGNTAISGTNGIAATPVAPFTPVTGLVSPASDKSLRLGSTPTSPGTFSTEATTFSPTNAYSLSNDNSPDHYGSLPSNASISLSDDLDTGEFDSSAGLDISSLGETIRRNTNVISTHS